MNKLNTSPPQTGNDLGRELATAVISFHENAARKLGMNASESRCLGILFGSDGVTPGRIARETGLTTGAVTGILDRLEKAGFVAREPNPDDRRSSIIKLLRQDEISVALGPVYMSLARSMETLARGYTPEELAVVTRYLKETIAVLRAETEKLR